MGGHHAVIAICKTQGVEDCRHYFNSNNCTKRDMRFGVAHFRDWVFGPWSPSKSDGLNVVKW